MSNWKIDGLELIDRQLVEIAAFKLMQARRGIAFTGAGISVESGIPPFRGPGACGMLMTHPLLK